MEYGYEVLCALDLNFQRCDRQLEVTFVHCCLQLYVTCSNINAKQTGTFVSHRAVGRFQNLLGQIKQKAIKYGICTKTENPVVRIFLIYKKENNHKSPGSL